MPSVKPADVGQIAAQLRGEKARRYGRFPVLEVRGCREPVEAVVQLNGVEDLGVALEPGSLWQPLRVEDAAPVGVLPTRRPDTDLTSHAIRDGGQSNRSS